MAMYDQNISQLGTSAEDQKQFANRFRNVAMGTSYDLTVRTTGLVAITRNEDGSETKTALDEAQSINVLSAWCSQKMLDANFEATLDMALKKASLALMRNSATRIKGTQTDEELINKLQTEVMRTFLGCFPQIPRSFTISGIKYEIVSNNTRYYAKSWIIPDKEGSVRTIQACNIKKNSELVYYYPTEFVTTKWKQWRQENRVQAGINPTTKQPVLTINGQIIVSYIAAADINDKGTKSVLQW
jgi:hypothetical protein